MARPRYTDTRTCCVVRTEPPNAFWYRVRDATGAPGGARSLRARHRRVLPREDGASPRALRAGAVPASLHHIRHSSSSLPVTRRILLDIPHRERSVTGRDGISNMRHTAPHIQYHHPSLQLASDLIYATPSLRLRVVLSMLHRCMLRSDWTRCVSSVFKDHDPSPRSAPTPVSIAYLYSRFARIHL